MKTVALLILTFCLVGCSQSTPPQSQPDAPPVIDESSWKVVDCSECDGKGEVIYDDDHFMVINGLSEPGTYTCPICGGLGELLEEER